MLVGEVAEMFLFAVNTYQSLPSACRLTKTYSFIPGRAALLKFPVVLILSTSGDPQIITPVVQGIVVLVVSLMVIAPLKAEDLAVHINYGFAWCWGMTDGIEVTGMAL